MAAVGGGESVGLSTLLGYLHAVAHHVVAACVQTGEVLSVMRQLAEEGMTMLVVTNEMGFARGVSSKTVFMENGVVVEAAPSQEFFAHPKEERTREFLRKIEQTN